MLLAARWMLKSASSHVAFDPRSATEYRNGIVEDASGSPSILKPVIQIERKLLPNGVLPLLVKTNLLL